jgi:hypothetical protein
MRVLRNVLGELVGMFAGDTLLSLPALLIVGIAVAVHFWSPLPPYASGLILGIGCLIAITWRTQTYTSLHRT